MSERSRIKGVFFDAFWTLIELEAGYPPAFAGLCREFGYAVEEAQVERVLPPIEAEMARLERMRTSYACTADELYRRWVVYNGKIFEALGVEADVETFTAAIERRFDAGAFTRPYGDALETLDTLRRRGYRLGIISNGTPGVAKCLELSGITERVEFALVSALVGWEKPAPEIFHMALEATRLRPDEVVFIGDHYEADIMGAQGVGMQAVLIDREGRSIPRDCPVVRDLREFRQWLDGERETQEPSEIS